MYQKLLRGSNALDSPRQQMLREMEVTHNQQFAQSSPGNFPQATLHK